MLMGVVSANFLAVMKHVLEIEGGSKYTNDPDDPGGPTKYGITLETLSRYYGRKCSAMDVQALSEPTAMDVYRKLYWLPLMLDSLKSPAIQLCLMDQGVHRGVGGATSTAQEVINLSPFCDRRVTVDGDMGKVTIGQLARIPAREFCREFIQASQHEYLDQCIGSKPPATVRVKIKYLRGWINRSHKMWDRAEALI